MSDFVLQPDGAGSLADRIYARIVEAVLRGDFAASNKLPTETALARLYGVSRPTVREALARLRSDGIIESRRGSGSHLARAPQRQSSTATPIRSMADIERYYAFRSCVEAGAAAAAAEYRSAADLVAIRAGFDALSVAMESGRTGVEEDLQFHLAIARASHNPFFVSTLETSVGPIRQFIEMARGMTDKKSRERIRTVQAEHAAVVDAIARRSANDAADAIRAHVFDAKRRIFEGTWLQAEQEPRD